jgi:restriction endonuclease S subunit
MKLAPYEKYKNSNLEQLGDIPEHWTISRIKFFADLSPSKFEVRNLPESERVTFLPMESIGENGELDTSRSKTISEVLSGYTYVAEDDVMIAKITPCFENGKGAIAKNLTNGIAFATTEVIPLRCKRSNNNRFLYYLLSSLPFRKLAEGAMYGAGGQKRVSDSYVANYKLAYPPPEEQQQIAAFLDRETAKIDTLIAKQQHLIALLREKRQAVISHAVTKGLNPDSPMKDSGVAWLGQVPTHWEIKKFNHCANIRNGQVDPTLSPYRNYVLIAPNHIESGTGRLLYKESAVEQGANSGKYLCKKGEVIYSKIRPALAKAVICDEDVALCSADMYPINGYNGLLSEYLFWLIISQDFTNVAVLDSERVAMPKVNRETLGEYKIPCPPEKEQKAISIHLFKLTVKIDSLIAKVAEIIELLKERRTALISAAVTGKIDVRNNYRD